MATFRAEYRWDCLTFIWLNVRNDVHPLNHSLGWIPALDREYALIGRLENGATDNHGFLG